MRILFIVPYAPSLIRSRSYNFLMQLAGRRHDVTLATLVSDPSEQALLSGISGWGVEVIAERLGRPRIAANLAAALLTGVPLQSRYSWSPQLAERLRGLDADVVHVEHLRGAYYGLEFLNGRAKRLPVVWDSVDSITRLFKQTAEKSVSPISRLISRIELGRTSRFEARMTMAFDHVIVTSELDRLSLLEQVQLKEPGRTPAITIIPQGVDFARFHPFDIPVKRDTIVFSGKMSYHANVTAVVHFVREIMPLIWARRPETRLQVVGKAPDHRVVALAADPRIEVTGEVPEVAPYIAAAAAAVAPIRYGAGIQNKVLEAMACCTPVVASPQAVAALMKAAPGRDVLVAGDAAAFAGEVLRLLEDEGLRTAVGAAGFRYVNENYRWEDSAARLEDVYYEAIQSAL